MFFSGLKKSGCTHWSFACAANKFFVLAVNHDFLRPTLIKIKDAWVRRAKNVIPRSDAITQ